MRTLSPPRALPDADTALATAAIIGDLDAIRAAAPAAEGACLHAARAFEYAFVAPSEARWRHATAIALSVLERSIDAVGMQARVARRRLAAFVAENGDLLVSAP